MRSINVSRKSLLRGTGPFLVMAAVSVFGCQAEKEGLSSRQFQIVGDQPACCETETARESGATSAGATESQASLGSSVAQVTGEEGGKAMAIRITSSAFQPGQPIPKKYTGEGADVSPPLEWSGVPEGTQELALICDDPDAPTPEPWVHWVLYKIPPDVTKLPEDLPKTPKLDNPPGALQGKNSWTSGQTIGYRGPMPPPGHGRHRYYFRIYALNTKLNLPPGATKKELMNAMKGHILAEGELMGTYERK